MLRNICLIILMAVVAYLLILFRTYFTVRNSAVDFFDDEDYDFFEDDDDDI